MRRFFLKTAMAVSASLVGFAGLAIAGPRLHEPVVIALIVLMFAWAGVECYIGFSRPVEGIEPANPVITTARMFWLAFVFYSWFDLRSGWTVCRVPSQIEVFLITLCSGALAVRTWAIVHLGESFTYDVKRPREYRLVVDGPYRFIRHPGYLGIIVLAAAPGLIIGSLVGFLGLLLSTLTQTIIRIEAEEELLAAAFGETFRAYQRKTRQLVPFLY